MRNYFHNVLCLSGANGMDIFTKKIPWRILGAVIIIAAAVVCFLRNENKTVDKQNDGNNVERNDQEILAEEITLNITKAEVSNRINERHEAAKRIMTDSVEQIFDGSEASMTKNETAKKKIFDDLDNM